LLKDLRDAVWQMKRDEVEQRTLLKDLRELGNKE
jgi:hypothetical protein